MDAMILFFFSFLFFFLLALSAFLDSEIPFFSLFIKRSNGGAVEVEQQMEERARHVCLHTRSIPYFSSGVAKEERAGSGRKTISVSFCWALEGF